MSKKTEERREKEEKKYKVKRGDGGKNAALRKVTFEILVQNHHTWRPLPSTTICRTGYLTNVIPWAALIQL